MAVACATTPVRLPGPPPDRLRVPQPVRPLGRRPITAAAAAAVADDGAAAMVYRPKDSRTGDTQIIQIVKGENFD